MITESLIRKKFVHNTMTDAVNRLYAAWRPAVSVFQVRSGELQRFAQSGASSKQISGGSYELRLFIPLHLRFLDIQYRKPKYVHIGISIVFILFILIFKVLNSTSLINAVYILCSYTYGPILGLFAYALLIRRHINDNLVPYIAIASPLFCFLLDNVALWLWNYKFGYELLMLNGLFTFVGLVLIRNKK